MSRTAALAFATSVLLSPPAAAVCFPLGYTPPWTQALLYVGDPAPGGGTFALLHAAAMSGDREIVFSGWVDSGTSLEMGLFAMHLWSQDPSPRVVARDGDPAPDWGTYALALPDPEDRLAINFDGEIAFVARVDDGVLLETWLVRDVDGSQTALARPGGAPGGGLYAQFFQPTIDEDGDVAFRADLVSGESGIFLVPASGAPVAVARTGDPAPLPVDGTFESFGDPDYDVIWGHLAFPAVVSEPGGTRSGVISYEGGVAEWIALEGEPAPGGGSYGAFPETAVDRGYGSGYAVRDGSSLYRPGDNGALLARVGDEGPCTGGALYTDLPFRPALRYQSSHVLYVADLGSQWDRGLFMSESSSQTGPGYLLARTGDPAPGPAGGSYLTFLGPSSGFEWGYADDQGAAVFVAALEGGTAPVGLFLMNFPEPGGPWPGFAALGLLAALARRRGRR